MITLLYGEDLISSRRALSEIKEGSYSAILSWSEDQSPNIFLQENRGPSLWGGKNLLVFESQKKEPLFSEDSFLKSLSGLSASEDVVLWCGYGLNKKDKLLGVGHSLGGMIRPFKGTVPKQVFPYLDALARRNAPQALESLHSLQVEGMGAPYLVTMIAYQLRILLRVKLGATGGLSPFVVLKSRSAVGKFSENSLIALYTSLLETDWKLKTSSAPPALLLDELTIAFAKG